MRRVWLKYTNLTDPTPDEVCKKGLTTPRGTFIFVADEKVRKLEAIKRCNKMGAILAPITEREDFDRLIEFGNKCKRYRMPRLYWLGYEAHSNDTRLFSNGEVWDWEKHTKIYSRMHDEGKTCTLHVLSLQQTSHAFVTGSHYGRCEQGHLFFICLKPAPPKCAKCEAVEQSNRSYANELVLSNGILMLVVCILVALLIRKKQQK